MTVATFLPNRDDVSPHACVLGVEWPAATGGHHWETRLHHSLPHPGGQEQPGRLWAHVLYFGLTELQHLQYILKNSFLPLPYNLHYSLRASFWARLLLTVHELRHLETLVYDPRYQLQPVQSEHISFLLQFMWGRIMAPANLFTFVSVWQVTFYPLCETGKKIKSLIY